MRARRMGRNCIGAVEVDRRHYARFPVFHGDAAVRVQRLQETHSRSGQARDMETYDDRWAVVSGRVGMGTRKGGALRVLSMLVFVVAEWR